MITDTVTTDISALGPVHIAVAICVALAIIGSIWVFIAFSDLCCCLRRPQGGSTGPTDEELKYGAPTTNGNDEGTSGSNTNKDGDSFRQVNELSEERVTVTNTGDAPARTNTLPKQKSEKKTGFFSKKENKKTAGSISEKNVPMRDRISMFESSDSHTHGAEHGKDGTKPKKKKPTSQAFQEFERKGIIIGFGNRPRKRVLSSEEREEDDPITGHDLDAGDLEVPRSKVRMDVLPSGSKSADNDNSNTNSLSRLTDDEGIHTMDEEDDFNAVTRNSEVLKSFRRAPPPKHRSRASRPMHNRLAYRLDETDFPGFDFNMGMDEVPDESECSVVTTPSHSTDSIATPSDRVTPDDDTATSGHHTEEDSPRGATPDSAAYINGASSRVTPDSPNGIPPTARYRGSTFEYRGGTSEHRGSSSSSRECSYESKDNAADNKSAYRSSNVETKSGIAFRNMPREYKSSQYRYDRSTSETTSSEHRSTPGFKPNANKTRRSVSDFRGGTSESRNSMLDSRGINVSRHISSIAHNRGSNPEYNDSALDSRISMEESRHISTSVPSAGHGEKPVVLVVDSGPEQEVSREKGQFRARQCSTKEVNEVSFTDFMSLIQRSNSKIDQSSPVNTGVSKSKVSFRIDGTMGDNVRNANKLGTNTQVTAASQLDNPAESPITAVTSPTFTSRVDLPMASNNPNMNNNNVTKTDNMNKPSMTDCGKNPANQISGGKLLLTRPRSFHPTNFTRSRDSPSPSSTTSRNNLQARGRFLSTATPTPAQERLGAERARSLSLGSPKFLRKLDSDLSELEAWRKAQREAEDKQEDGQPVEKKNKVFQETAL